MRIDGTAAIVSGGASGLGAATVAALRGLGARVAILDLDRAGGAAVADRTGARFHPADITSETEVALALDAAQASHGVARILVNCAGIAPVARLPGTEASPFALDLFRRTIEINLVGTAIALAGFAARLTAAPSPADGEERGVIVNTASIAAFEGQAGMAGYAASKAAVAGMTLPLARDLAAHAIRVMAIAPGMFDTAMVSMLDREGQRRLAAPVPFPNRLGRPEEFARLVAAILENPMLNGSVIRLDAAHRLLSGH